MAKIPQNHRKVWTNPEIKELKQLIKENTPTRVIADIKLKRTEEAVRSKVSELKLSLNPPNRSPYNRTKKQP